MVTKSTCSTNRRGSCCVITRMRQHSDPGRWPRRCPAGGPWPLVIVANDGRIQVAVTVDLRAAQERVIDEPPLAGLHDVGHAGGHQPFVECPRIAHADRHPRQAGPHAAGLEQQRQLGRHGLLRQHGRRARARRGADDHRRAILQAAGGGADHEFHRVVRGGHVGLALLCMRITPAGRCPGRRAARAAPCTAAAFSRPSSPISRPSPTTIGP